MIFSNLHKDNKLGIQPCSGTKLLPSKGITCNLSIILRQLGLNFLIVHIEVKGTNSAIDLIMIFYSVIISCWSFLPFAKIPIRMIIGDILLLLSLEMYSL